MAQRIATLEARVLARLDTVRKARAHADDSRASYRAALLGAYQAGASCQRLADLTGCSWGRMDELLKRAAAEAGAVK